MADSVLYFPMIRPPESAWFARVLLYWDKVGTMMPAQYSEDHAFLQPYTSALVREGLLTVVPPDESVWRSGATNYFDAFLALVDSDPFGVRQEPANEREWASVHVDKTGLGLAMALEDRGLAERYQGAEYAAWVQVEHHTADLLMAFLASIVGKDPNVVMDPITDSEASMAAFTTLPEQDRQINAELEPIRSALLDEYFRDRRARSTSESSPSLRLSTANSYFPSAGALNARRLVALKSTIRGCGPGRWR